MLFAELLGLIHHRNTTYKNPPYGYNHREGAFLFSLVGFCLFISNDSDHAGDAAENGAEDGGGADDGVVCCPHDVANHQVAACNAFVTGGDEEHAEHSTGDGQQFQQILAVDGRYKTGGGHQTVETQTHIQTEEQRIFPFLGRLFPECVNQIHDGLHNRHSKEENAGADLIQKYQV